INFSCAKYFILSIIFILNFILCLRKDCAFCPPRVLHPQHREMSVHLGDKVNLECKVEGHPVPRVTWVLPNYVHVAAGSRAGRYTIQPNGTLAIQQVSVYDQGPYVCRASNEYGSSLLSILVNVIAYPPKITNGPPSVTYAKRGVAVQLNCVATGIPKVELAWETPDKIRLAANAKPKLFENKYLLPQGSLIIQNPTQRDAGIYRCTARNAIGFDSKATVLNVCRVPVYNFHRFAYHPFQAFRKCIQFFFFYIEDQFTTTISSGHFTLES
uniref:Ig-like domain-containing protein n=1 Tax=Oreochromis aureus TaxID=47969 RepID=A0AAZ1X5A7_OREAU